jgi:polyhydroxyalkanoate synthesis regulator phasin
MEDEAMLAQVEAEIHAMNGGINPQEAPTQEESVPTTDENENEENENKTEKKIKKLLSQRNEEKKEKESLAQRLAEIENKLADTEFYKDNQAALEYKQDIDSLVNER